MKTYTLKLTLLSPCLIGSGEGFGAVIDSDIVFDEFGIPYIPAKRIKGCLRDSAIEVCEMFELANINLFPLTYDGSDNKYTIVSQIFGKPGDEKPAPVYFSNLTIEGYEKIVQWIRYLMKKYPNIITRESIINQYTELRQQTAIEETGTAKEHSLRTIRVAKKEISFKRIFFIGEIDIEVVNDDMIKLLYFACENLRYIGTKRNRGFGKVKCELYENSKPISYLNKLEELCEQ
jgi:CRISPR/Cas system CSM-associated protein Csm3 (group 7 of RAMP superfamily)